MHWLFHCKVMHGPAPNPCTCQYLSGENRRLVQLHSIINCSVTHQPYLEVYPMLKRFFCILLVLLFAASAGPANASENEIPDPVSSFFDTPDWEGYQCVSALVHDEGNGARRLAANQGSKPFLADCVISAGTSESLPDLLRLFHLPWGSPL